MGVGLFSGSDSLLSFIEDWELGLAIDTKDFGLVGKPERRLWLGFLISWLVKLLRCVSMRKDLEDIISVSDIVLTFTYWWIAPLHGDLGWVSRMLINWRRGKLFLLLSLRDTCPPLEFLLFFFFLFYLMEESLNLLCTSQSNEMTQIIVVKGKGNANNGPKLRTLKFWVRFRIKTLCCTLSIRIGKIVIQCTKNCIIILRMHHWK